MRTNCNSEANESEGYSNVLQLRLEWILWDWNLLTDGHYLATRRLVVGVVGAPALGGLGICNG